MTEVAIETLIISGRSDDLVEVEGPGGDEWGYSAAVVVLSTGDRFAVRYDDTRPGVWSVDHVHETGEVEVEIERAPDGIDPEPYTDRATVEGPIAWVDCWREWPPSGEEIRDRIDAAELLERLSEGQLLGLYDMAHGRGQ